MRLIGLFVAHDDDWQAFLKFALDFIENTGKHFLEPRISKENRGRCKQLIFPDGIMIDKEDKVYTPEISTLYRLAASKKAPKRQIIPIGAGKETLTPGLFLGKEAL